MSIVEFVEELFACGFIGRLVVCAPILVATVGAYAGLGQMAKADETMAKAARQVRYN